LFSVKVSLHNELALEKFTKKNIGTAFIYLMRQLSSASIAAADTFAATGIISKYSAESIGADAHLIYHLCELFR